MGKFEKGHKKIGGIKKGTKHAGVTERWKEVFALLQDEDTSNLFEWAKANPTDFYKLSTKLIPLDINHSGDLSGKFEVILRSTPIPLSNSEDDVDKE